MIGSFFDVLYPLCLAFVCLGMLVFTPAMFETYGMCQRSQRVGQRFLGFTWLGGAVTCGYFAVHDTWLATVPGWCVARCMDAYATTVSFFTAERIVLLVDLTALLVMVMIVLLVLLALVELIAQAFH